MMLPPGESFDPDEVAPYDESRGSCPRCGSSQVRHLMIGMPAGEDAMSGGPEWVSWVGCVHPGYNRVCDECGGTWATGDARSGQTATHDTPRP